MEASNIFAKKETLGNLLTRKKNADFGQENELPFVLSQLWPLNRKLQLQLIHN